MSDTEETMESTKQDSIALHGRQKAKKLKEVLAAHKGEIHIVAIQDFPDPAFLIAHRRRKAQVSRNLKLAKQQ